MYGMNDPVLAQPGSHSIARDPVVHRPPPPAPRSAGAVDVHGQQLDLRSENSWLLRLHQASTHLTPTASDAPASPISVSDIIHRASYPQKKILNPSHLGIFRLGF